MNIESFIRTIHRSEKHNHIYHFTDNSNIPLIRSKNGILSKELLRDIGLLGSLPKPGGNTVSRLLDEKKGIFNYVSLCLTRNHPMGYKCKHDGRHPKQKYLAIEPNVLKLPGVLLALGVANADDTEILPLDKGLDKADFELVYNYIKCGGAEFHTRMSSAEKLEVLVPNSVPARYIKRIREPNY